MPGNYSGIFFIGHCTEIKHAIVRILPITIVQTICFKIPLYKKENHCTKKKLIISIVRVY